MEKPKQKKTEFEKWPAISASVGAVDSVLASKRANVGYVVAVLA